MSKQIASNPTRISFNPKNVDVEALDEIADDRDVSRAELIRETLGELINQEADDGHAYDKIHKPDNEQLRNAFETLLDVSNHPLGPRPISVEEAKNQLYSQSCGKAAVKRKYLEPLSELGFITVRNARIAVHRRTVQQVEAAKTTANEELDQLEASDRPGPQRVGKQPDPEHQELLKYQRAGIDPPIKCIGWVSAQTVWGN